MQGHVGEVDHIDVGSPPDYEPTREQSVLALAHARNIDPMELLYDVHLDAVEYHDAKQGDQLVFMHAVKEGPANRSFGLQVAALAGLPKAVIADAKQTLIALERGQQGAATKPARAGDSASPQPDLFAARPADPCLTKLAEAMREIDPDSLSPREALEALYRLRRELPDP